MKIITNLSWIRQLIQKINRKEIGVVISDHALKDKNLSLQDLEKVEETVRTGIIDLGKSWKKRWRVCFKKYFKHENETYYCITRFGVEPVKVITVIRRKGRY